MSDEFGHDLQVTMSSGSHSSMALGWRLVWLLLILCWVTVNVSGEDNPDVSDEICVACHDGYLEALSTGSHALAPTQVNPSSQVSCLSCHTNAAVHVEDPAVDNIGRPAGLDAHDQEALCSECHQPHTQTGTLGHDPHLGLDLGCTDCHTVHSDQVGRLRSDWSAFCGRCHVGVSLGARSRSNHPLVEGFVDCLSCHSFRDSDLSLALGHGPQELCASCHQEKAGPYFYEHGAASSFAPEGGGCVVCHQPHGSISASLLSQPPDGLCRQCHGIPPAHLTQHDGVATGYDCIECHSGYHGSNSHRSLLDPQLGTVVSGDPDGCSCHSIGELESP